MPDIRSHKKRILPDAVFCRIRTVLLILILVSGMVCSLIFYFFWIHIWDAYKYACRLPLFAWDKDALIEQIQEQASRMDLPANEKSGDRTDFSAIFDLADEYTGLYFYGDDGLCRIGSYPAVMNRIEYGSILSRALDWYTTLDTPDLTCTIRFRNADSTLLIHDFHHTRFIPFYVAASAILCTGLFLGTILLYVNSRIRGILRLHDEITLMSSGDLTHPVPSVGRDEIGSLGAELDQLRIALASNFRQEEEARRSNQDLIAAMSHDLRTPLTILNGYLEVLRLRLQTDGPDPAGLNGTLDAERHSGHDGTPGSDRRSGHDGTPDAERYSGHDGTPDARPVSSPDDYLDRCIQKVADIRELTDRMFEYALVYEVDETPELTELPAAFLERCLLDNLDYIRLAGFTAVPPAFPHPLIIRGDETMLKRVFTNLFSNILKYGDKRTPVAPEISASDGAVTIRLANDIRDDLSDIAGNQIGLKSVQKIVCLHHGTFAAGKEGRRFTAELTLPLYSPDS